MIPLWCAGLVLALGGAAHAAAPPASRQPAVTTPMRIVSLNPCLDAMLVELVPIERIAAISYHSRDPQRSTIASLARRIPVTDESAEEVIVLRPDLVLLGRFGAPATRNALRDAGVRVELFDVPASVAQSLAQIRRLAALLEREERGAALVARIERALLAARPPPARTPLSAVIYQVAGLTAGTDTVIGELMQVAGLVNVAAQYGVEQWRPLPLELLVSAPPQVLLVGEPSRAAMTQAERLVLHRALRALGPSMSREIFPERLLYCAGPVMIEALAALAAAREHAYSRIHSGAAR